MRSTAVRASDRGCDSARRRARVSVEEFRGDGWWPKSTKRRRGPFSAMRADQLARVRVPSGDVMARFLEEAGLVVDHLIHARGRRQVSEVRDDDAHSGVRRVERSTPRAVVPHATGRGGRRPQRNRVLDREHDREEDQLLVAEALEQVSRETPDGQRERAAQAGRYSRAAPGAGHAHAALLTRRARTKRGA